MSEAAMSDAERAELTAARAEFEHRLRQLNDIVERNGGDAGPVGAELRQVRQNLADIERALKKVMPE